MKLPLVGLCLVTALVAEHPIPSGQSHAGLGLAMTHLALDVALDYGEGSVGGWASYEITNRSAGEVTEIPFNVGRLMTVRAATGPDGSPLEFSQQVAVFRDSPRRQVDHVVVSLPRPLASGGSVTLKLQYDGYLVGYTETGSIYIQDRVDEAFSILRTDAFAWPVLGTLSRRTNRMAPRPDFHFSARVTVPERFTVASGGRLVDKATRDGRTTFVYESVAPAPFLNLPIAEYAVARRGGLRVYHFPADSAGGRRVLEESSAGLALLERWFGPLGVDPEFAVMEIPEMWGSQASLTGGIIQTADAFREPGAMSALYHELSHLWNAPDRDQPSARWNEGLASFLSRRMASELHDWSGMEAAVERTTQRLLAASESEPEIAAVPFRRYGEMELTDLSYQVGFLMFYALHRAMGDEPFDAAIRRYYVANKERGGTFETLIESLQSESPVDLGDFFQEWVYSTGWYDDLRSGVRPEDIGFGAAGD